MMDSPLRENAKSFYMEVLDRVKRKTGIDTISLSIQPGCLIVDDTSKPECLLMVSNMYNAPYVSIGTMESVGVTCEDLEEFGILTPIQKITPVDGSTILQMPRFLHTVSK